MIGYRESTTSGNRRRSARVEPDMQLSPAQHAAIRRLSQPAERSPADDGELNVVPFLDIVTNVLLFVLATLPAVFTSTIPASLPSTNGRGEAPLLGLTVALTREGVSVKTAGGNLAPGCDAVGEGVTIAPGDGAMQKLRACATRLKATEAGRGERTVRLVAEPDVDYQAVVRATDALRETDGGEPLFPDVLIGTIR